MNRRPRIDPGLEAALAPPGNTSRIARALHITPTAVILWKRVPARHLEAVESLTGIPKSRLRPDLVAAGLDLVAR